MDGPLGAQNDPALIDKRLIEPAPKHLHGQRAVGGDAAHHSTKLIHVRVDHDARSAVSSLGNDGAHTVIPEAARQGLHNVNHDGAHRLFGPRRPGGVGKLFKKGDGWIRGALREGKRG